MEPDSIKRHIQIDADPQDVWNAISDPAEFGAWFRVRLDGPFAVGETTTGRMTYPGHEGVAWLSVTEVLQPPERLVFRWPDCAEGKEAGPDTNWIRVEFTLQPRDGGTLVTVCESGFSALPKERRISMLRANREGWDLQTENLRRHVEG